MPALVAEAKSLLTHLSNSGSSNNIYFHILCLTVDKCEKALEEDPGAEIDFDSYVPKEFISNWNFPGLTFCWVPFDFQDMFQDIGSGF